VVVRIPADPRATEPRARIAAIYEAIAMVQADPLALRHFTYAGQAELNRVAMRCDGAMQAIDRDADEAA
jgi:hypothetical protein